MWIAFLTTVAALFVHAYLTVQHFNILYGEASGSICDVSATFNCTTVSASRYAELFGIPVALWGFAANLVLMILLAWFPMVDRDGKPAARFNLILISGAIALASIVMGSISAFLLTSYCLFCITAYVLSFATLICLWLGLPKSGEAVKITAGQFKSVAILGLVAFVGVFIAKDQITSAYGLRDIDGIVQGSVNDWQSGQARALKPVDPLVEGAASDKAKMTIVEFADFRCIHCKHAAPILSAFVKSHPDVRLEFQPWPLDGECNSVIPTPNGASCELARISWCAEKNGGHGWLAHGYIYGEDIFSDVAAVEAAIPKIAQVTGVNDGLLSQCVASNDAKDAVRKQADFGNSLNLQGTPTLYINGKLLPPTSTMAALQEIYSRLSK